MGHAALSPRLLVSLPVAFMLSETEEPFRHRPPPTIHQPSAGLMLGQCSRRWTNGMPTLDLCIVFVEIYLSLSSLLALIEIIKHVKINRKKQKRNT